MHLTHVSNKRDPIQSTERTISTWGRPIDYVIKIETIRSSSRGASCSEKKNKSDLHPNRISSVLTQDRKGWNMSPAWFAESDSFFKMQKSRGALYPRQICTVLIDGSIRIVGAARAWIAHVKTATHFLLPRKTQTHPPSTPWLTQRPQNMIRVQ